MSKAEASLDDVDRLIEQFDPEANFRRLAGVAAGIVTVLAVGLSSWHYYTAGFGCLQKIYLLTKTWAVMMDLILSKALATAAVSVATKKFLSGSVAQFFKRFLVAVSSRS